MDMDYDAFIIGTGVAGSSLAYKLRKEGMKVAIADKDRFGGICAIHGCIPKKIISGASEIVDAANRMKGNGPKCEEKLEWSEIVNFKNKLVDYFTSPKEEAFIRAGIDTYHGLVSFHDSNTLLVEGKKISSRYILITVGATSRTVDIPGAAYLTTSDEFLDLKRLPDKIIFAGGGYISFEFAHMAARAGSDVTIIHRGENLLKTFDRDIVNILARASEKAGISIITNQELKRIEKDNGKLRLITSDRVTGMETVHICDMIVHGLGRVPATEELLPEKGGVETEKGAIAVNEYLQSVSNPSVYAAGDCVVPGPALTPSASLQASVAADNILYGNKRTADYSGIASAVFTIPAIASVGMTEKEATDKHEIVFTDLSNRYSAMRTKLGYSASKVIIEKDTGRITGAHIIGPNAEDTINLFTLAISAGLTAEQVREAIYAYPASSYDVRYMLK